MVKELIKKYERTGEISVATLASHSSLQIIHGAKQEGLRTVLITLREREWFYKEFQHLVDEMIVVDKWRDVCSEIVLSKLVENNAVMIPHGSLVEYIGLDCATGLSLPYFGNRHLFVIEGDQQAKMNFLANAGIPIPRTYKLGEKLDRPVIVKLPGAKGGKGYFISSSMDIVEKRVREYIERGLIRSVEEIIIQEYVVGTPAYYHYFYSPVMNRLEIMGADIRYESNVDGLRRIPVNMYGEFNVDPSFIVVGNLPLVLRESLLPKILEYGKKFVEYSVYRIPPGVIGPFCLESIITETMDIVVFEFSGRIVAGTNLYIDGSPYSYLYWNEPMSTGRRIARELKMAIEKNVLHRVLT
ncbi:MAG: formate--phosphoribosylaminoimidazolecarboxamide ligase [Desulfurococcaceae archaeon]